MTTTAKVQDFMKEQMEEAQKRFQVIEGEAKKALGKIRRFNAKELKFLENPSATVNATVKQISKKANAATNEMKKRFDALQEKLGELSGVATQAQIRELNKELHRLAKKVEGLVEKKAKPEARA
jgi:hypothetical protein